MYLLVNRNTGKQWRKAPTREMARQLKRSKGFKHVIVRAADMAVVR